MRAVYVLIIVCCLVMAATSFGAAVPGTDYGKHKNVEVKGHFGIRFADHVNLNGVSRGFGMVRTGVPSVDKIFDNYQVSELRALSPFDIGKSTPMSRIYQVQIPEGMDDDQFKRAMLANPNIVEIQNDVLCPVHASPNDPNYSSQWHHYQASRKDMHMPEAWDVETGSENVIIAIIDSGVNYKHPDLRNNIWINPDEDIDGDRIVFDKTDFNNTDDNDPPNGYRDDVIGYDFLTGTGTYPPWDGEDGSVRDNDPNDFNGHGTNCAGIAAASTNNGLYGGGISGGWGPSIGEGGVSIMCLRAGYSANVGGQEIGYVMISAVIEAINYAANNGADIISYSAGSSNYPGMSDALNNAMNAGIVFCASAGNENCDCPDYFGLYNGILAVAASNRWDGKWTWTASDGSNYGNWVEITAPGQDIYSTYSYHYNPTHATLTGTSMAAPMVAGLAALIKSHHPEFSKTEIENTIMNNAHNIDAENPSYIGLLGAGRIDAWNCLQNTASAPFDAHPYVGEAPLMVQFDDQNATAISRSWTFGDGDVSSDEDPVHEYLNPGLYDVSLEVTDPNGTYTKTKKYCIVATADTLYGDEVTMVPVVAGSDSFPVPIYMKNTVPLTEFTVSFDWYNTSGTADLDFKGVSLEGTRGEDFDSAIVRAIAPTTGKVAVEFRCINLNDTDSDELMPGDGPVAKLWFKASGNGTLEMDTVNLAGYYYHVESRYVGDEYRPEFRKISLITGRRGDANNDDQINTGDPVYLINYVFKAGPPPPTIYQGDANADGDANIADAVYLINHVFKGGPAPPP